MYPKTNVFETRFHLKFLWSWAAKVRQACNIEVIAASSLQKKLDETGRIKCTGKPRSRLFE